MRLAIGYPAYRAQLHAAHVFQACQLTMLWWRSHRLGPTVFYVDSAFVDKARNLLIRQALDARCDWLLMCDADTYFVDPRPIARMLVDAERRQAAVIGAPVRLRKWESEAYNVAIGPDFRPLTKEQLGPDVRAVDRIGGAFTAISLAWIREYWAESPWFMVQHKAGPRPKTVGEDIWFCDGVRQRGGAILADPRFEPIHAGASPSETLALQEMGVGVIDV